MGIRRILYEIEFESEQEARESLKNVEQLIKWVVAHTPNLQALAVKVVPMKEGCKLVGEGVPNDDKKSFLEP